jgi:hypothetical protein
VPTQLHAFTALVLGDFCFASLFQRAHTSKWGFRSAAPNPIMLHNPRQLSFSHRLRRDDRRLGFSCIKDKNQHTHCAKQHAHDSELISLELSQCNLSDTDES